MTDSSDPGFAPADPTDDRGEGEWQTRYSDPDAKKHIRNEAIFLGVHLIGVLVVVFVFAVLSEVDTTNAAGQAHSPMQTPGLNVSFGWQQILHAWLGGVLGGAGIFNQVANPCCSQKSMEH